MARGRLLDIFKGRLVEACGGYTRLHLYIKKSKKVKIPKNS